MTSGFSNIKRNEQRIEGEIAKSPFDFFQQKQTSEYNMFYDIFKDVGLMRTSLTEILFEMRMSEDCKETAYLLNCSVAGLKSLVQLLKMALNEKNHTNLKKRYSELEKEIHQLTRRPHLPKQFPTELKNKVDDFFELLLDILQKCGLGIKLSDSQIDVLDRMEKTITGD